MQWKTHSTVEIVSNVPAGTPGHATPYSWQPYDVQPERVTVRVWEKGWSVDVDCKRIKKDGTVGQTEQQISYTHGVGDVPAYVMRAVEHAQQVRDFAFPATTTEPTQES